MGHWESIKLETGEIKMAVLVHLFAQIQIKNRKSILYFLVTFISEPEKDVPIKEKLIVSRVRKAIANGC